MNMDTVRKCAEIAAASRAAALGIVDADIIELLDELDKMQAEPVVEEAPKPKAKAKAAAPVEEAPAAE